MKLGSLVNFSLWGLGMRIITVTLAVLIISGCQTKQIQEMSYKERQELAGQIVKRCVDQGVKNDSHQMHSCIAAEVDRETYTRQQNLAKFRRGMAGMSAGMAAASRSYADAANRTAYSSRTVTCRSNPAPTGYTSISCY